MASTKKSLSRRYSGLSIAVLALAISFGGTARAADSELAPSFQEMVVAPLMKAVTGIEERLAGLEARIGAWADAVTTKRIVVEKLCIADESGAQTCVTKGQLDAFLRSVAQADVSAPLMTAAAIETTATQVDALAAQAPAVEKTAEGQNLAAELSPAITEGAAETPLSATDNEAEAPAIVEPSIVTEANVPAPAEPTEILVTIETAEPVSAPAEAVQLEQETEHTGTVIAASTGNALVYSPEVEISIAVEAMYGD